MKIVQFPGGTGSIVLMAVQALHAAGMIANRAGNVKTISADPTNIRIVRGALHITARMDASQERAKPRLLAA